MSEHLPIHPELFDELRSPEEILEIAVRTIEEESIRLSAIRFETEAEAREAHQSTLEYLETMIQAVKGFNTVDVTVAGSGVFTPEVSVGELRGNPEHGGFVVIHPLTSPVMKPHEHFETESGHITAVGCQIIKDDELYRVLPTLVLRLGDVEAAELYVSEMNISAYDLVIRKRAIALLDGSVDIKINELERLRQKYELADDIARNGLVKTLFAANLNKLKRALVQEDPVEHIDLKKLKIIKAIGRHGELHARKGIESSDAVVRAILDTLGVERSLVVSYEREIAEGLLLEDTVSGSLSSVLMPASADDETRPSLVLQFENPVTKEEEDVAIPFESIQSFKY